MEHYQELGLDPQNDEAYQRVAQCFALVTLYLATVAKCHGTKRTSGLSPRFMNANGTVAVAEQSALMTSPSMMKLDPWLHSTSGTMVWSIPCLAKSVS
jgi:hypothetical protein